MTVVIVNHNTVEDLRRCLTSLRESEHTCSFRDSTSWTTPPRMVARNGARGVTRRPLANQ